MRTFTDDDIAAIRAALLAYFDAHARPLPWRDTQDPYAIWISEVMSQQTRVETVIPYYQRWLRRFPDVAALADAPLDDVLKAWEGLGYYSRARNLHAASRVVREQHHGSLPRSYESLRTLPGVGEYTAGAVSSIAFGAAQPAVDGNVRRVLSRMLAVRAPSPAQLRALAATLVPADRPGDFNQALMELGAVVCTSRAPRCDRCPVADRCAARAAGTQESYPQPKPRATIPIVDLATAVLCDDQGRMLLIRRPAQGLLAGMWSFPAADIAGAGEAEDAAAQVARRYAATAGAPVPIGTVEHVFSHRRERYHCFMIAAESPGRVRHEDAVWVESADTPHALPRGQQRIRELALNAIDADAARPVPSNA